MRGERGTIALLMRRLLPLLFSLLTACAHLGQEAQTLSFTSEADLLLEAAQADGAVSSAWVADAATGEVLYARREATRLLPASTLKVVTTAAALAHLGHEFRFRTPISLRGQQRDEVFAGALVVEASGDPSLGSWRWPETSHEAVCDRVAQAMAAQGIRRWEGGVELVQSPAPSMGPGWAWDDAPYDYSAVPTQFVFRENVVDLRLVRAPGCGEATVEVSPRVPGFTAEVALSTAPRRSVRCQALGVGARCRWSVPEKACPREASFRLAAAVAPGMFEACVDEALSRTGLTRVPSPLPVDGASVPLLEIESPPLSQLVRETNKESLNLYAERLGLELARHFGVEGWDGVGPALMEDVTGRGVPARDLVVVDGSGLSRYNLATARALGRVMWSSLGTEYGEVLVDSLPVAGVDGTLARRKLSPAAAGQVRAKSGTLTGQRAWTGVIERPGDLRHPRVVFTLMLGNASDPSLPPAVLFERFAEALVTLPIR